MLINQNKNNIIIISTFTILSSVCLYLSYKNSQKKKYSRDYTYVPPLPTCVVKMLHSARLCTLATSNDLSPHLSLMNFSYYQEDEVIILTTQRATKKFDMISNNPEVALLINDFPMLLDEEKKQLGGRTGSITLNGWAEALDDNNPSCNKYRNIHLSNKNNKDYAQFIQGPDIAVIVVRINSARICDIHDKVIHWNR